MTCSDNSESTHRSELSLEKDLETDDCHGSSNRENDSHSSNNCNCQCHGNFSSIVNLKDEISIHKLEPRLKNMLFPNFIFQKLNGYLSRLNRPPIS